MAFVSRKRCWTRDSRAMNRFRTSVSGKAPRCVPRLITGALVIRLRRESNGTYQQQSLPIKWNSLYRVAPPSPLLDDHTSCAFILHTQRWCHMCGRHGWEAGLLPYNTVCCCEKANRKCTFRPSVRDLRIIFYSCDFGCCDHYRVRTGAPVRTRGAIK